MAAMKEKKSLKVILGCLVVGMGLIGAGQFYGGWRPCSLCRYQQYIYLAASILSALGLFAPAPALARGILASVGGILLLNAGVAFYQVGVEQQWFPLPSFCKIEASSGMTVEALREQLLGSPVVRCDKPMVHILGLSLACYSFLFSCVLGGMGLTCALSHRSRKA